MSVFAVKFIVSANVMSYVFPEIINWALPCTGHANSTGLNANAGVHADKTEITITSPTTRASRRNLTFGM